MSWREGKGGREGGRREGKGRRKGRKGGILAKKNIGRVSQEERGSTEGMLSRFSCQASGSQ